MRDALTDHPLYRIWRGIIERCEQRKSHAWRHYGGRGIAQLTIWRQLRTAGSDAPLSVIKPERFVVRQAEFVVARRDVGMVNAVTGKAFKPTRRPNAAA